MKKLISNTAMTVLAAAILFASASNAQAFVSWSNASGSADSFDWSNGGSDIGLFGDPNVVGDTFVFFPNNFRAESTGGFTDIWDTLSVEISAHLGSTITGIQITEYGDYGITGCGLVNVRGSLDVEDTDNGGLYSANLATTPAMPITQGGGSWSATVSISQMNAQNLIITLENGLLAFANPGSSAFIQKEILGGAVAITIIPEPATLTILTLGAVGLLKRRKA
ncbi:MAG: PEP-CTERM sorting domain-containing protein [Anaerohalosphaeraceae bacterium]|nr:PEP-CTERM sorting domain-containing protein [Anaerohalosphaeraceae bacterium]